jgi:hypothetical protein
MSFLSYTKDDEIEKKYSTVIDLIPDGTICNFKVATVTTKDEANFDGEINPKHIVIELIVVEGKYKGISVNHKLKVFEEKESTRDKHRESLLVYDSLCEKSDMPIMSKIKEGTQTIDEILMNANFLSREIVGISIGAEVLKWEMNGSKGNYIGSIFKPVYLDDSEISNNINDNNTDFNDDTPF